VTRSASLVDDSGNVLLSLDADGLDGSSAALVLTALDLGFPAVRENSTALSGMSGELDVTQYMGGRAITAEVGFASPSSSIGPLQDTIRGLMHPGRRYWLYVQLDGWSAPRMIRVRGASLTMPTGPLPWTGQLGWKAALPTFQDAAATTLTLSPQASSGGGETLPETLPEAFSPGLEPGAAIVTVSGNANARPTVDIYGPCSGPLVRVVNTGAQMSFTGLSIAAGSYLHIDCQARTITLNSDPSQSVYNFLDFSTSQWLWLPPGSPQVVFSPSSSSSPCVAVMSWHAQWL
jgi:hypothetical protein